MAMLNSATSISPIESIELSSASVVIEINNLLLYLVLLIEESKQDLAGLDLELPVCHGFLLLPWA